MEVSTLIEKLIANGISVSLDGEELRVRFKGDSIDPELLALLKENKQKMITYLSQVERNYANEIQPSDLSDDYPVSDGQYRLWVLSQNQDQNLAYNIHGEFTINNVTQVEKLKDSIYAVINRHESLRTVFLSNTEGEVRQRVIPFSEFNFTIEVENFVENENVQVAIKQKIANDLKLEFDLENGPLVRIRLFQIAEADYIFYYNMHHIISDGWSMGILYRDVLAFYKGDISGVLPALPQLNIQYKDFSVWQKKRSTFPEYEKSKTFWNEHHAGEIPLLDLPSKLKRPEIKGVNGHRFQMVFSNDFSYRIKEFSKENGAGLFTFLQTSLNTLFFRYTGLNIITVGSPFAGRTRPELADQIGFYVNTLAIKNKLEGKASFLTNFDDFNKNIRECLMHQDYSLDELINDLKIKKEPSRSGLFDIMIELQNELEGSSGITPGVINDLGSCNCKFDVSFIFQEQREHLALIVEYDTEVYEKLFMERMISHFENLSLSAIENPNQSINQLEYLSLAERQSQLIDFNQTERDYSKQNNVIGLFENQVEKNSSKVAFKYENHAETYDELNKKANQFGRYLRDKLNVKNGEPVGIKLKRSPEVIYAVLGVLKAGGAYVPIDPAYPEQRINYLIEDSTCNILINEGFLKEFEKNQDSFSQENLAITTTGNDLAYIIYTSGSTGKPKGVMIQHESIVCRLQYMINIYDFNENDVALFYRSYSFDGALEEYLLPFVAGATCVIAESLFEQNLLENIKEYIPHFGITKVNMPPVLLNEFANSISEEEKEEIQKTLKHLVSGGDKLSSELAATTLEVFPLVKLHNTYGPTENTIDSTHLVLDQYNRGDLLSIGFPVENTKAYILDSNEQLLPIGLPGELCFSGIGLAKGYLNRPELTAEKFVANPYLEDALMYRTGDLACWHPNGEIEFLGRLDDQIKIRGFRIELGEVESAMLNVEGVRDAVVLVRENETDQKELVAYLVVDEDLNAVTLRAALKKSLPDYMIPAGFVQLEKIPVTVNGKANRKALASLPISQLETGKSFVPPQTEKEIMLAAIWQSVLKQGDVGLNDNFYDLGGDSIKSIQIISRLKEKGFTLKVADLLKNPEFTDFVSMASEWDQFVDQSPVTGNVELTPIQNHFFQNSNIPNKSHYNQSVMLDWNGNVDQEIFHDVIEKLFEHHDALRLIFKKEENQWIQNNNPVEGFNSYLSFHSISELEKRGKNLETICNETQESFELNEGPLFKAIVFQSEKVDQVAFFAHHLVIDAVSWRVLLQDFATLYSQAKINATFKLPLKTNSFQEWSLHLKSYAKNSLENDERTYWNAVRKRINGLNSIAKNNALESSRKYETISFELNESLTKSFKEDCYQAYKTTANDILLTALGEAMSDIFDVQASSVLLEGHGREELFDNIDVSRTVGWFTSLYPFVLEIEKTTETVGLRTNWVKVKEDLRQIPNKGIGYGLLEYSGDYSEPIACDIVFNYLGEFNENNNESVDLFQFSELDQGNLIANENDALGAKLSVSGIIVKGKLSINLRFKSGTFESEKIKQLNSAYQYKLETIISQLSEQCEVYPTPSDYSYTKLSIEEYESLIQEYSVEDFYLMSPMQQGFYFHWLQDRKSQTYFGQKSFGIQGSNLDLEKVKYSFESLIDRHAVLRTSFVTKYGGAPLQIVQSNVACNFKVIELPQQLISAEEINAFLEEVKNEDRAEGFDLNSGSQMRLTIVVLNNNSYEFIWSNHHILMDGWCVSILLNEFYTILNSDFPLNDSLLDPPAAYSNYIRWLDTVDTKDGKAFWKNYLEGYNTRTTLPSKKGNKKPFMTKSEYVFDLEQLNLIQKVCRDLQVTENTFLQTVWGYLLSVYNATDDVVYGAVVSGRPSHIDGIEDMVGLFINTIPVRIKYTADDTPKSLLKRMQAQAIESLPYHYLNIAEVQEQSALGNLLIDHIMVYENYAVQELKEAPNQELEIKSQDVFEQNNFEFSIQILPTENETKLVFNYDQNQYTQEFIDRYFIHISSICKAFTGQLDQPLLELSAPLESDVSDLDSFNDTDVAYTSLTVMELFEKKVSENPNAIALVGKDDSWSYSKLNERANQLAECFRNEYGIQNNSLVGVLINRSFDSVACMLAIMKAGAIYVPFDPRNMTDRMQNSIEELELDLLIVNQERFSDIENVVDIDKLNLANYLGENTTSNVSLDQGAFIIHTSGSTGKPKGVLQTHKMLSNLIQWGMQDAEMEESLCYLQYSSFGFDVSIQDCWTALCNGGSLYVVSDEMRMNFPVLLREIVRNKVEVLSFPYTVLNEFYNLYQKDSFKGHEIKHIISYGEKLVLSENLLQFLNESPHNIKVHNHYGPSETHVITTCTLSRDEETITKNPGIGKPIANTKIQILDSKGQSVPIGSKGEIYVQGASLALGYVGNEKLTEEKFGLKSVNSQERLYKTGDMGRWLSDGTIELLERIDNQIKISGYRVELEEIEAVIREQASINQVKVIAAKNEALNEKYLIAFVVGNETFSEIDLANSLEGKLPSYMIPSEIRNVSELPITVNGKVDGEKLLGWASQKEIEKELSQEDLLALQPKLDPVLFTNKFSETIIERFQKQAEIHPDSIAIEGGRISLTYDELNKKANQLAAYLRDNHALSGNELIGIKLERSPNVLIAILAVLKVGGAYVPIELNNPEDRVQAIINDSQLKLIIDTAEWNKWEEQSMNYASHNEKITRSQEDLVYVIFTSGSTGKPKGVMITEAALNDYVDGIIEKTNLGDCKTFGMVSTFSADLGYTILYPSLILGGHLKLFTSEEVKSPTFMSEQKVDCVKIVPTHWRFLNEDGRFFAPNKCLILGGEELKRSWVKKVADNAPECQVYNHYGPTETTIGKLIHKIDLANEKDEIPIGSTIGRNQIFILNKENAEVSQGEIGEIFIAGRGVAKGYVNNTELTDLKFGNFLDNQIRIYRTGDLGKQLPNGEVLFCGRADEQVKIRGYRIELGEIEGALQRMSEVKSAAVIALPNKNGEPEIAAYVVFEGAALEIETMRERLSNTLPDYMWPAHYVQQDSLPFTTNGKLDKKALPLPNELDRTHQKEYAPPTSDVEEKLVTIWEKVLGREKIGIKDNFFDLGGHSLKVIRILGLIESEFDVVVDVKNIFQTPTIEKIAVEIDFHLNNRKLKNSEIKQTIEI